MATLAHCAYCFETLSASLEKRQQLNLHEVELLWDKYNATSDDEGPPEDEDDEDEDMEDARAPDHTQEEKRSSSSFRPAAIARLLAPSTSSSSSSLPSTTSSTPSTRTQASSSTSVTSSKTSSRSSFFSLGRQSKKQTAVPSAVDESPLFVTWNTISRSGNKQLRGCIGTFEDHELDYGLRNYALTSAFEDHRFPPIASREFSSLECGVTLLTDFEPAPEPLTWELGKHGLRISFTYHNRRYGATYLPDVPVEQGWTKEETIVSLMRKAGWSGRKDDWKKVDLNVITYQGRRVTMSYQQWREFKEWLEEQGLGKTPLN